MKKIMVTVGIITLLILTAVAILKVPIKKAIKIGFENIEQQNIDEKDTRIICKFSTETGPQWEVIGKGRGLFNIIKPCEYVIITGNIPKHLNGDIYSNSSSNKFIFDGNIVGEESGEDGGKYKVFKVKQWSMAYPIFRGYGFVETIPSDKLTPYDFIPLP